MNILLTGNKNKHIILRMVAKIHVHYHVNQNLLILYDSVSSYFSTGNLLKISVEKFGKQIMFKSANFKRPT